MPEQLALWSFENDGGELYALSTGRIPPAEEQLIKGWKLLSHGVEGTEEAIRQITHERAGTVLDDIRRQGYCTLEPKMLRDDWKRPPRAQSS
jgi:hypothetical protein